MGGLAVLTVLSVIACNDSPTAPSPSANLIVQLTDGHTDNVDQVNLFFTSVTANPISGPPETIPVVLTDNPQDLLVLRDAVIPLAIARVEPGDYGSLRINLDEEQSSIVEGGEVFPIRIPSEEIKILGALPSVTTGRHASLSTLTPSGHWSDWATASGCSNRSLAWRSLSPEGLMTAHRQPHRRSIPGNCRPASPDESRSHRHRLRSPTER